MTDPVPDRISNPQPPVQQDLEDVPTVGPQADPDPQPLPDPPTGGVEPSASI